MEGIVCFELRAGQRIRIRGANYHVTSAEQHDRGVTLRADDEIGTTLRISRAELQALVVLEEAEMVDELEEPDRRSSDFLTNLSFLSPHRLHDWQLMVILIRAMLPVRHHSYKSPTFRRAYDAACELLAACKELSPIRGGKTWSMHTIYHTLRRWRASGYAYAALQKKGIAYRKPNRQSILHRKAREIASEAAFEKAGQTIAALHRETNRQLSAALAARRESAS